MALHREVPPKFRLMVLRRKVQVMPDGTTKEVTYAGQVYTGSVDYLQRMAVRGRNLKARILGRCWIELNQQPAWPIEQREAERAVA